VRGCIVRRQHYVLRMHLHFYLMIALLTGPILAASASAQYDRDGRYVPSPNGVPLDPTARPVPMDSGKPGDAIGTPIMPRSEIPRPTEVRPLPPRLETQPSVKSLPRYVAPKKNKVRRPD
jgi:hypothetical protein